MTQPGAKTDIQRCFLGWDRPAMDSLVAFLFTLAGDGDSPLASRMVDLRSVVVAVPGTRAGRRLQERLTEACRELGKGLLPPRTVTVGRLPELLYRAARPFADRFTQQLAWVQALRSVPEKRLSDLLPHPPELLEEWMALADALARLHRELAADGLDCTDVLRRAQSGDDAQSGAGPLFSAVEIRRWEVLAEVQQKYLRTLDALELWDLQTARLVAIDRRECAYDGTIVLAGTVDMNVATRRMLDQVADRVTALIFAPESEAERFDAYGCLAVSQWQTMPVDLPPERIRVVDEASDQASAVLQSLAGWSERYATDEIVLGVPDAGLVPFLHQALEQHDLRGRYGVGFPLARSAPFRLLAEARALLTDGSSRALAALVRQPEMETYLRDICGIEGDWLTELDGHLNDHLPLRVSREWSEDEHVPEAVRRVTAAVFALLDILSGGPQQAAAPILPAAWGDRLERFFAALYGHRRFDRRRVEDRRTLDAVGQLVEAARRLGEVPPSLAPEVLPPVLLGWIMAEVASQPLPEAPCGGALEMLGWLELPLDDAPAVVVTGMNEGVVPSSFNADVFLPNRLRTLLGLEDNDRRFARDAYALTLITQCREDWQLIAGRRRGDDPISPSRLLFSNDPPTLVEQVRAYFGDTSLPADYRLLPEASQPRPWEPPRPKKLARPIRSMRVTQFRDYLACPYRFYLRHVLGLELVDDAADELSGAAFGSLAHEVLAAFGASELRDSTDTEQIAEFLLAEVNRLCGGLFGKDARPTVPVQIEQLKARLRQFAQWQAEWRSQGWQIVACEYEPAEEAAAFLEVDGQRLWLRGRIDRIDYHAEENTWLVFDYKSSDTATDPDKAHRNKEGWCDLQLPLYRHLLRTLPEFQQGKPGANVGYGYICLANDLAQIGAMLTDWTDADLDDADRAAREVIRNIWEEKFWPPASPAPPGFDDLACLLP